MSTPAWSTQNLHISSSIKKEPITFHYRLFTRSAPLAGSSSGDNVDTPTDLPDDATNGDILVDGERTFHRKDGRWCRAGSYTPSARTAKKNSLPTDAVHSRLSLRIVDGAREWATQAAFRCARNRQLQDEGNVRGRKRQRIDTNTSPSQSPSPPPPSIEHPHEALPDMAAAAAQVPRPPSAIETFLALWKRTSEGLAMSNMGTNVLNRLHDLHAVGRVEIADITDPDSVFYLAPNSFVDDRNPYTLQKLVIRDVFKAVEGSLHIMDTRSGLPVSGMGPEDVLSSLIFDNRGEPRDVNDPIYGIVDVSATKSGLGTIAFKIPAHLKPAQTVENSPIRVDRHELMVSSTVVPGGTFTPPHHDHKAAVQPMVHITGVKLWGVWPRTLQNSAWVVRNPPTSGAGYNPEQYTLSCLENLEGCQVFVVNDLAKFMVPRWALHFVLTATNSVHTGGAVYSLASAQWALDEIQAVLVRLESLPLAEGKSECSELLASLRTWENNWAKSIVKHKKKEELRVDPKEGYEAMGDQCYGLKLRCRKIMTT